MSRGGGVISAAETEHQALVLRHGRRRFRRTIKLSAAHQRVIRAVLPGVDRPIGAYRHVAQNGGCMCAIDENATGLGAGHLMVM